MVNFFGGKIYRQFVPAEVVSPSEISSTSKEFAVAVEEWRTTDLSDEKIKYLFMDEILNDKWYYKLQ